MLRDDEDYNQVILIGTIEKKSSRARRRSPLGTVAQEEVLRLVTPFGEPWTMRVAVPHTDIAMTPGHCIVLEGTVRLAREQDRRFAREDKVRGRRIQAMKFQVERVRMPCEGEEVGASYALLQGTVFEPPQFVPHPHVPGLRLALTTLRVVRQRPSPIPGSQMLRQEPMLVHLSVPIDLEHASMLWKPGNRVHVAGELDCVLTPVDTHDPDFVAMRKQLEHDWHETGGTASDRETRREERRQFVAALRSLSDLSRWRVFVREIVPLDGAHALSRRQARTLRAAFVARRHDRVRSDMEPQTPALAQSEAEGDLQDVRHTHTENGSQGSVQPPRRRRKETLTSSAVADTEAISPQSVSTDDAERT